MSEYPVVTEQNLRPISYESRTTRQRAYQRTYQDKIHSRTLDVAVPAPSSLSVVE